MSTTGHQRKQRRACLRLGYLLTTIGLIAPPLRASVPPNTRGRPPVEREVLLSVTHARVPSKVFHTARDISVWLPDAAAGTITRYPVLVFPDAEEKGQFRAALANIQFLIDRQLIPPLIVVGVPYLADRIHELTPPATGATAQSFPTAGGADRTMQFIADELLPWVDAHYPTLPTRVLAGHSAGGLFALYAMIARPDVFRVVIAMSPALFWNDGAFSAELATRIAADTLHTRTLFLISGGLERGGLEAPIDSPTTAFAGCLTALLGSVHTSVHANRLRFERWRYPRDGHSMTPLPGLVDGLRMAFEPLLVPIDSVFQQLSARHTQDSAEIRTILERLESQYVAGATALGVPAPFPEAPLDVLGSYSLSAKQPGLAVKLLRENRDRYPHSGNAHESLGEALVAIGDTSGGVAELRTAIALATSELHATASVLTRARDRAVTSAALAQLHAIHRDSPGLSLHPTPPSPAGDGDGGQTSVVVPLDETTGLTLLRTRARAVIYRGRQAVELTEDPATANSTSLDDVALLDRPQLEDGTIEVWVAGTLGPGAAADDRGFIGLTFRSTPDGARFENIYLRPTNGRADDQLRRNHSAQYASFPDYPWHRLRAESPGKYESYVDLVPGDWTHIRVVLSGQRATLFVNDAPQPCLVVNDLKMPASAGRIGLWIGPGTRGYFSHMVVTPTRVT